jgi:hypothetical protein
VLVRRTVDLLLWNARRNIHRQPCAVGVSCVPLPSGRSGSCGPAHGSAIFFANLLNKHMDQGITSHITKDATALGGKSWTAYLRLAIITLVAVIVSAALMHYTHAWIGLVVLLLALLHVGYQFAVIRSYRLYFDDVGVWLYSGILPWNKGIAGVKWRDLDEAVFYQSMWSWISKSYSIRIGHRFTKSSEIMLDHWARGNDAVVAINEHHQAMIRAGALN